MFFQPVPIHAIVPASFSGIYSEDDYVNAMVQRTANDYALAHARVQAFERQGDHCHYHHHHHQHRPGGSYRGCFAPASLDNFSYGFAPACARPTLYAPHRRPAAYSPEQLSYRVYQEEERQRALNRQLEAIARQQELAREREARRRRRTLAEAAAREQQARAARVQARQAHDQEVLLALLGQLGLVVAPTQSAQAQVNREQPSAAQFTHSAPRAAPVSAPIPIPTDRKGKGKAVDVPVVTTPISFAPIQTKAPTFKEELEARIRSETDPEVRETLVLLYSDIFDARQPAKPVAGPSGHRHVSFDIPIIGPSPSTTTPPVPVKTEEQVDITTIPAPVPAPSGRPETDKTMAEEHHGASFHRTPALPPAIAAKLLKFYRARRARKLSLVHIADVEEALHELEGAFEFPAHLDFVDRPPSPSPSLSSSDKDSAESALAYTPNNTPIHAYEHALNDLLTRLDAVESNGDLEIRGRRKEVVKEVERALEAMERRIEESRERSREGARRGSMSSQVSDASVTVTPYDVHSSDNVNKVEVAVATEEANIATEEAAVAAEEVAVAAEEVLVEVEESKSTPPEVDAAPVIDAEGATPQVEVSEPIPAAIEETLEVAPSPPSIERVEPDYAHLAAGIPDSGADIYAQSPSHQLIHGDPSSPVDDDGDLGHAFDVSSSSGGGPASHSPSGADECAVPSNDHDLDAPALKHDSAGPDVQPEGLTTAATPESDVAVTSPVEPSKETNDTSPTPLAAPKAISRIESSATDTAFVTAEADSVPPSAAGSDAAFFTAGNTTPSELEPSPTPPPASAPPSDSESASSAGEETFLLSSTPLADEQLEKHRRPSTSESVGDDSDELEIIGREELEAARNGSDWSDVESDL